MVIISYIYQKKKQGKWYPCIKIEGNKDTYLDTRGNLLTKVYDLKSIQSRLCIDLAPILKSIRTDLLTPNRIWK